MCTPMNTPHPVVAQASELLQRADARLLLVVAAPLWMLGVELASQVMLLHTDSVLHLSDAYSCGSSFILRLFGHAGP